MTRSKLIVFFALFIVVGSLVSYYYFYKRFNSEIITIGPDEDLIKKKPEDPGGIVIANSDSLVYEKLQSGIKKNRKIYILPEPEEPIILNINKIDDSIISLDAIDEILSKSEYYNSNSEDESNIDMEEYIIPNILKNQSNEINEDISEEIDSKIFVSNSLLNITKLDDNQFEFSKINIVTNENNGYKIQLSVASSNIDANKRWKQIVKNHPKILHDANLITKKIEGTNNRIFYMVLAGTYPSLNHAKLICKRLISRKQNCIVVK